MFCGVGVSGSMVCVCVVVAGGVGGLGFGLSYSFGPVRLIPPGMMINVVSLSSTIVAALATCVWAIWVAATASVGSKIGVGSLDLGCAWADRVCPFCSPVCPPVICSESEAA